MGRYKRHSKTKTIVKGDTKLTYTVTTHTKPKNRKDPLTKSLIRDFLFSVKKNDAFRKLIVYYKPFYTAFNDSHSLPKLVTSYGGVVSYRLGEHLECKYPRYGGLRLYNSFLGRLSLINVLLDYRYKPLSESKCSPINKHQLLEYYAKEELKKRGVKVYPNNLVFALIVGTIFALIGYISIMVLLWCIFGFYVCLIYSIFIIGVLLVRKEKYYAH